MRCAEEPACSVVVAYCGWWGPADRSVPALFCMVTWHDADVPEIRYPGGRVRHRETLGPADLPVLGLDGTDLAFIRIDHQTRLQFGQVEIVIETPFRLRVEGAERTLDPGQRADLGELLAIYPATLVSAVVAPDLTLRLTFESGTRIDVPQHPRYESWHVVGPGQSMIVCPPTGDGTLAVWR